MTNGNFKLGKVSLLSSTALTRQIATFGALGLVFGASSAYALDVNALPDGGNVVGGAATISQSGSSLNVNQSTDRTVIDWRSFNIGSNATVDFVQPGASSIAVNRVNSSSNPTEIQGSLKANGQVWILNPNGVLFGKSAKIDVAGIVASTGDIDKGSFMRGDNRLQFTGSDSGFVSNEGTISVADGGLAAFVAPSVRNSGVISARVGRVTLAAGTTFTLDLAGDDLVELGLGANNALVDQSGSLLAAGSVVNISAKAAGEVVNSVINVSGAVLASGLTEKGGQIILTADNITTTDSAVLAADGGANGNGGSIYAYADKTGSYSGSFSAKGGSVSGNGGSIETSGKKVQIADGISVNTLAAHGATGNWTIDPDDLTVTNGSDTGSISPTDSSVTNATIVNQLLSTGVTLAANNSITVGADINSSGTGNLALNDQDGGGLEINLNAKIILSGAGQTLSGQGTTVNVSNAGLIQNGVDVANTGGATVNVAAGDYNQTVSVHKDGITLAGAAGSRIIVPSVTETNAVDVWANNFTITGFEIAGPAANESYLTYNWGSVNTRGVVIHNGATNFEISNNNIHGLRNDILIDGRNTGSITNNVIDNSKSGISVQYTDAGAGNSEGYIVNISGNAEGPFGNEWGLNTHLNGHYVGATYYSNAQKIATDATAGVQAALLANSAANGGWSAQDQGYSTSNRTSVVVSTTGSDANQGSRLNSLKTIQAGIKAVVAGGTVNVNDGTYVIPSGGANYISIGKSLNLIGQSEAGTIIDAHAASSYGIRVIGGTRDVNLSDFTLYGVTAAGGYGIKVEDSQNVNIDHVTSHGAYKAQFDLNGLRTGSLDYVTADGSAGLYGGGSVKGAAIAITDSQNVTVSHSTTNDGSYGGLAIYQSNNPSGYTYQTNNITIDDTNSFSEANPVYMEDSSATHNFGTGITVAGFDYAVGNNGDPTDVYTFFQKTKQNAFDYATAAVGAGTAFVQGWTGSAVDNIFQVGYNTAGTVGLSINAAIQGASSGAAINVDAGVYNDALNINKNVDIIGSGSDETFIRPDALYSTGVAHKYTANMQTAVFVNGASDVNISGVTIDGNGLSSDALVFWNNASGSINDSVIKNVRPFSGAQTGQGIAVDGTNGTVDLTVSGVTFLSWNKNAIDVVNGNGGSVNGSDITLNVTGSTFTGAGATDTIAQNGIALWERAGGTINATVDSSTFSDINYSGDNISAGVLVYESPNATLSVSNSTFNDSLSSYIAITGATSGEIDATVGNIFGGVSLADATLAQIYVIEDKIEDGLDDGESALVRLVADNVYVTQASGSIQNGIDKATAGDTVNVDAGIYDNTLNITKNINIVGAGQGDTIVLPTTLLTTGVAHKYDANMKVAVFVDGANDVNISGMTIDGNELGGNAVVFWNNASGSLNDVRITNPRPFNGAQTGQGLAVDATAGNTVNLTVSDATFDNWNKNAIDVVTGQGATTNGGNVNLTVEDSTFTGGGTTDTIAQNGILLWERGGGTIQATVDGSSFSGINYSGDDAAASGILVYGSPNTTLTVSNSSFDNIQNYIALSAGSSHDVDATSGNTFDGVAEGSATLAQLFDIENHLEHKLDDAANGLIRIVDNQIFVTAAKNNVQAGIDAATGTDTVNVQAGTYTDDVSVTAARKVVFNGSTLNSYTQSVASALGGTVTAVNGFIVNAATTLLSDTVLNGAVATQAIDGSSAGGQSLTVNGGSNAVSLGNLGATTRLGVVNVSGTTALHGSTYQANALTFNGPSTLTQALTTFDTSAVGGNITFTNAIFGTTDGAQSVIFNAGPGTSASANGDISMQNVGTNAIWLGSMVATGNNLTAQTVYVGGDYNSTLAGNQIFSSQTLHTRGDVNSDVGGNATGPIISGGMVGVNAGGNFSGNVTAPSTTVSAQNISGNFSGTTANLTATNSLDVTTSLTNLTVNSPSGTVSGTFDNYTGAGGPIIVNGKTQTGSTPSNPNQIVVEGFTLPAGTFINSDGQIVLPSGMLVGLVSPAAGPGAKGGKQKVVIVHSVQMLGQLLAEGYVAIIVDLSKDNDEIEEVAMN